MSCRNPAFTSVLVHNCRPQILIYNHFRYDTHFIACACARMNELKKVLTIPAHFLIDAYKNTIYSNYISGTFVERPQVQNMRECISSCCDSQTCDLAFMFGQRCYSVVCNSETLCQAVLAKPSSLEPRISYVSRTYVDTSASSGKRANKKVELGKKESYKIFIFFIF